MVDKIKFNNVSVSDTLEIPSTNAGETNSLRWHDSDNKLQIYDDKEWHGLATESFVKGSFKDTLFTKSGTIYVGPTRQFKDIQSAWNSIKHRVNTRWITIKVDDGTYKTSGLVLNDINGRMIKVVGNLGNPEKCVIKFVPDKNGYSHGVRVYNQELYFSGFNLVGEVTSTHTTHRGMYLSNSTLHVDTNTLIINNTFHGIECRYGTYFSGSGVIMKEVVRDQFIVASMSFARAHHLKVQRSSIAYTHKNKHKYLGGCAFNVNHQSRVYAHHTSSTNMHHHGHLSENSHANLHKSNVDGCRSIALAAYWDSILLATWSTVSNSKDAVRASYNSTIHVGSLVVINHSYMAIRSHASSFVYATNSKINSPSGAYGMYAHENAHIESMNTSANNKSKKPYSSKNGVMHHSNSIIRWS